MNEIIRYIINGVIATIIHFGVLTFNVEVLNFNSVGLANMIASVFGIAASFIGSRYYVFNRNTDSIITQAVKFSGLYGAIALLHGFTLFIWSDWFGFDYRLGFVFATGLQVTLSYIGNKYMVFKI